MLGGVRGVTGVKVQLESECCEAGVGWAMLDDAIAMAMEELFALALTCAHGELGVEGEAERVGLDAVVLGDGPALWDDRHHSMRLVTGKETICAKFQNRIVSMMIMHVN